MTEPVCRSIGTIAGPTSCLEWASTGGPHLLFVHANGFNAQTYRMLLAPLSAKFRVLACDLRGHGASTLAAQPARVKGWTVFRDDLLALAGEISKSPVILAGHSLGATASFMAAAKAPEQVRALILIEPVFLAPPPGSRREGSNSLAEMAAQRRSTFPSFDAALDYYHGRGIFRGWPEQPLIDYLTAGLVENGDGTLRLACAPEWEAEIFRELPFGIASIVTQVKCPIAILRGTVASTTADDQVDLIVRARADTDVVTIDGANHFLPIVHPEHTREEIMRRLVRYQL
ncbi:MAG TPA: alpha/beta hydrolase [Rhizomicrobium sp.]|nr:alpha/beta hydrolase [Rhizomicrobium sp.]